MDLKFWKKANKKKKQKNKKDKVILYSTNYCPWCKKTKEFLKENKIKYTNKDVENNRKNADEMIKKSGQTGIPVIDINGKILVGYDVSGMEKALGI